MPQCTIPILSHDLTHHQHDSLSIQPCHISQRSNTSDPFLIIPNCTHTISPHPLCLPKSPPLHNTIPSPPPPNCHNNCWVPPYCFTLWQYPPPRFEVLQEHSPMVLASVDIVGGTPLLIVSHLRTSQVPKSKNHIQSTVADTITDSDILYYPQPQILDTPLLHQPPMMGEDQSIVPP